MNQKVQAVNQQQKQQSQQPQASQLNVLDWEQQINLSDKTLQILQQIEDQQEEKINLSSNQQQQQQQQQKSQVKKQNEQEQLKDLQLEIGLDVSAVLQKIDISNQELKMITDIKIANKQNQYFLQFLNDILSSLEEIKKHFQHLEDNKKHVVEKINEFYQESSKLIDEQKNLLELQQEVKSNLQYYLAVEEIEQQLDSVQKDMVARSAYEDQLQRYLSEIIDGIIFFQSHPSFQQQVNYLAVYQKLKLRMTQLIKNFFFKIFNKEFTFINTQLTKNVFKNCLSIMKEYKNFLEFNISYDNQAKKDVFQCFMGSQPQFYRCMINIGVYPQLKKCFILDHYLEKLVESGVKDLHLFELNDTLKNLISFIEVNSENDSDLDELYTNVFLKYMTYCRVNFQKELLENFQSILSSLTYNSSRDENFKKQDAFNSFCHFSFEQLLCEFIYTEYLFNFSTFNTTEAVKAHWQNVIDIYYTTARPLICWDNNNLELQFNNIDIVTGYIFHFDEIIDYLKNNNIIYKRLLENIQGNLTIFKDMVRNYFDKLRQEIMSRLIQQAQIYIQDKIVCFDINQYCKQNALIVYRFDQELAEQTPKNNTKHILTHSQSLSLTVQSDPKTPQNTTSASSSRKGSLIMPASSQPNYRLQRRDVFPAITNAIQTFKNLKNRVEKSIFQNMVCDIVSSCLSSIYLTAEKYEQKFDAMLFVIKNTLILNNNIQDLGVDFTIKEQELDFTEMKTFISDIQQGKLSHLYKGDNIKAENLWNTTTNFFKILYKGMPKLKEFTIDLKNSMITQLKQALESLNKDMTFIISKNIIDFIKRYHSFKNCLEEISQNEELPEDQAHLKKKLPFTQEDILKDLNTLLDQEVVSRCYHLFIQNCQEFIDEMISKMNNFLEEDLFIVISKNIEEIIENCIELFSQFCIILSKHLKSDQYDALQFPDPSVLKQQCISKVKFIKLEQ
ncbi:Sec34 family protein (macronuclear) [Tetrahymena thermophila SB210]|uniref:Conserved oligomeric Golgi complex subunit 3 n=1 Tax=Tetrahymena thermophila (strain SB210) TaxID=312017 RepID=I7MI11_TETTS|nr:Sec34 family protein [Tetrahymena thermophila SB210]EAR90763.1 Sec34 family protein [Tetrahymena thermophila SB210]|eukprot:XP_001011008.1 Sec34 family protein [Tetrahymena thermophila SB210]